MNLYLLAVLFVVFAHANAQGLFSRPDGVIEFYRRNRIPYWSKAQWTPLGYRFFWRRSHNETQERLSVKCSYSEKLSLLNCSSKLNESVQCETTGLFEKYNATGLFKIYAIAALPRVDLEKSENVRFALYPQMLEEHGWLNSTFVDPATQKQFVYSLYAGAESDSGLIVKDTVCYKKLVDLFGRSMNQTNTIVVGREGEARQVEVLGGIMLI